MHIITGLIVGALLGLKKDNKSKQIKSPLLSIRGVLESKHSLPGRERFFIPSIKSFPAKKDVVEKEMSKLQGVKKVEASHITGSALITYDEKVISPSLLAAGLIKLLDLEKEILKPPRSIIRNEFNHILNTADRVIYEKTLSSFDLSTIISFTFLGLFIKNITSGNSLNIGLLWWGYNIMRDKKGG